MAKETNRLKLGVVGLSPGNGHPYSWSAIFNGYDKGLMKQCPYQAIPEYLDRHTDKTDYLHDIGHVTHIWTQEKMESNRIAGASKIPHVCSSYEELVDNVDAVLLARDDAVTHPVFTRLALEANKGIFVDKPFAISMKDAEFMLAGEKFPGQIFTSSSLAYADELLLHDKDFQAIGKLESVKGYSPKAWSTYAPHIVEPVLKNLDRYGLPGKINVEQQEDATGAATVSVYWDCGISAQFSVTGENNGDIYISFMGEEGELKLTFRDSFSCFRRSLSEFCYGFVHRQRMFDTYRILTATRILEAARV